MTIMVRGVVAAVEDTAAKLDGWKARGMLEELLHWVALDTAQDAASDWELHMRQHFPHQRLSIDRLAKQLEVLDRLNPQWAAEFRAGIAENQPDVRLEDADAYPLNPLAEQTAWVEQGRG
ncbi:immunity 63 family protein [Streptomyces telluris]|uniref:Immunity 63 family protein n=1 Tax=Streptomyces telluris TaxID=2720021 RepID=A0A9X2LP64_9ACTN|nr:immunity 63 family protein [Streptomyces telluris]MCQ8774798.1 immunity 63 family protein [Streptomyces telluris]